MNVPAVGTVPGLNHPENILINKNTNTLACILYIAGVINIMQLHVFAPDFHAFEYNTFFTKGKAGLNSFVQLENLNHYLSLYLFWLYLCNIKIKSLLTYYWE